MALYFLPKRCLFFCLSADKVWLTFLESWIYHQVTWNCHVVFFKSVAPLYRFIRALKVIIWSFIWSYWRVVVVLYCCRARKWPPLCLLYRQELFSLRTSGPRRGEESLWNPFPGHRARNPTQTTLCLPDSSTRTNLKGQSVELILDTIRKYRWNSK